MTRPLRPLRLALVLLVVPLAWACTKDEPAPASAKPARITAAPPLAPVLAAPASASPAPAADLKVAANRVDVTVTEDGYVPAKIAAKAGVPITLSITRK